MTFFDCCGCGFDEKYDRMRANMDAVTGKVRLEFPLTSFLLFPFLIDLSVLFFAMVQAAYLLWAPP